MLICDMQQKNYLTVDRVYSVLKIIFFSSERKANLKKYRKPIFF